MNKTVLEYLEGYFDGQLNESTSDEDIMEAFAELLETANAVEEFMNEAFPRKATDDMHHQADMEGEVNSNRSNLDKSIDANNLLMSRRRMTNKYSDKHMFIRRNNAKKGIRIKNVPMLKIPPGASTSPKTPSLATKIRKLIGRRK